jgi:hypothetical protein
MIVVNTAEGIGRAHADRLAAAIPRLCAFDPAPAVAIDGRLLPHEWIVTGSELVKADAFDHHCGDFFPGTCDIAWDLAGASLEWELSADGNRYLMEHYRRLSNDATIDRRLPFYRFAYLGYRLGYATVARDTLRQSSDGWRFALLAQQYAARLRRDIDRIIPESRRSRLSAAPSAR